MAYFKRGRDGMGGRKNSLEQSNMNLKVKGMWLAYKRWVGVGEGWGLLKKVSGISRFFLNYSATGTFPRVKPRLV